MNWPQTKKYILLTLGIWKLRHYCDIIFWIGDVCFRDLSHCIKFQGISLNNIRRIISFTVSHKVVPVN